MFRMMASLVGDGGRSSAIFRGEDSSMLNVRLEVYVAGVLTLLGAALPLSGQQLAETNTAPAIRPADTTTGSQPELVQRNSRYVIQHEDVLVLTFPLTPELNQTVTVQPDGYINLQNGGSIHVQGSTVPEVITAVKTAYANTLHDPIVNVDLKDFHKPLFTVMGQVGKPGQYDLRNQITVAEGIALAGGLAPTAKTQVFIFHKTPNGYFRVERFNLKDVLAGKNLDEDVMLKPGDMIYVPEKFIDNFRKYVPYSVNGGAYLQQNPF
jgi:polysaccharide biosynthesis/export protein